MAVQNLETLISAAVEQLGFELVDLEVSNRGKLLRLFIDKPQGVNIDDCALVSNQVSNLLSVEIDYDYDRLEVSSPGLDRILKKEADFVRFLDHRAQVKLRIPVEGRKNFLGVLKTYADGILVIEVEGVLHQVEFNNIDKARLSPQF